MARSHGRILTTIWEDPAFTSLDAGPQRLYLFLLSQPDLNQAGLVALRLRRWTQRCASTTIAGLREDLDALAAARFVLVDEDTEEVLVRTFVRNDGVWRQPTVMQRMGLDAREIASQALRAALLTELARIDATELSDEPSRKTGRSARGIVTDVITELREAFAGCLSSADVEPPATSQETPSDTPSEGTPDIPSETPSGGPPGPSPRERVHARSPFPVPHTPVQPSAVAPAPPSTTAPRQDLTLLDAPEPAPPRTVNQRAQDLAGVYHDLVPLSSFPAVMRIAKKAIEVGHDDDVIAAALCRIAADNRAVTIETLRRELEGPPAHRSGRPSPGQNLAAAVDIGERLQREADARTRPPHEHRSIGGPR